MSRRQAWISGCRSATRFTMGMTVSGPFLSYSVMCSTFPRPRPISRNARETSGLASYVLFFSHFRAPPAQAPLNALPQRTVGRFPERFQLLESTLLQDLRLRLVRYFIRELALRNKQGLPRRAPFVLMRALLALRNVLAAAL